MRISTPLIVKNEAALLARCLESIRPWSDELIVMDTGSSDDTMSVASRYADRVCRSRRFTRDTPLLDFHFADARNEVLALCSGDWILSVDADEALRANGLRAWLESTPATCCRVPIRLATLPGRRSLVPRLFRRASMTWSGRYHDVPTPWDSEKEARVPEWVAWLDNAGLDLRTKLERNARLLERQIAEEPERRIAVFQLADTYRGLGPRYYGKAIEYFRRYMDVAEGGDPGIEPYVMYALSDCYRVAGAVGLALDLATELTRTSPQYERGWVALGLGYECVGQFDRAIDCYRRALTVADPIPLTPTFDAELDRDWIGTRITCCCLSRRA